MKSLLYSVKQFVQNINNLIEWFPVIWRDRQWDDYYFFFIIRKKLIMMERFYRGPKAHHLYALNDAQNIHAAILTLDRIIENNYLHEALEKFYDIYPNYDWEIKTEPTDNPNYVRWVDTMSEEQIELFRQCGKNADKAEQEDYDFLFKHLREHAQEWWD